MAEVFIGEREFAALLGWTPGQFKATRDAGGIPAPNAFYRAQPLWWKTHVDALLHRLSIAKEATRVDSSPDHL